MRKILGFLLLFHFTASLSGQNPHPYFRNYTPDDGLPSPEVHYVLQDFEGYMWFATDNGLSRFDGYTFKNFGPSQGLKDPVVFYLQLAPDGRLWAATMHGSLYYVERDSVYAFAENHQIAQLNVKSSGVTDFFIDEQGTKYLIIRGLGIISFSPENVLKVFNPKRNDINRIGKRVNDRWLLGSVAVPVDERQGKSSLSTNNNNELYIEIHNDSIYFMPDPLSEEAWSGGSASWLKYLDDKNYIEFRRSSLQLYKAGKFQWSKKLGINAELKASFVDQDSSWLMGFQRGEGLRYYENVDNIRTGEFDQFLSGASISALTKDRRGGVWICTLENGIYYCPNLGLKIYDSSCGFPSDHVVGLDFRDRNTLFIGFRDGNIIQYDTRSNQVMPFIPSKKGIVYDLLWDSNKSELWMTDGSLNYWKSGKWETIDPRKDLGINNFIISKKLSWNKEKNTLWGTHYLGYAAFDIHAKKFVFTSQTEGFLTRCFRILEDQQKRIWIASVNGLFRLKDNNTVRPENLDSLMNNRIEDISELSDGNLVLATKGNGILIWDGSKIHQLTTEHGLTSDIIENIHVDQQENIWAGTHLGLNRISIHGIEQEINTFTIANGLPSNEITFIKSYGDQLWIGTNKGLVQWKDTVMPKPENSPFIEEVLIHNKLIELAPNPVYKYNQNNIQFNFLSFNYEQNGKIPYRFRLNNGTWNNILNRSVNFAELAPGSYKFEVQSQNENGTWSSSAKQGFTIQPPFWQTTWFTVIWILGLSLATLWWYRKRIEQVREEARIKQKMNDLRSSALRAQMNPHFIFNCLNSIQNFIAQNDQINAAHYLARFAQLVRRALHVSTQSTIALEEEIKLLEDYMTLEQLRFKNKFDFTIEVDERLNRFDTELPPMLVQPFVENSIKYGMTGRSTPGKVIVRFLKKKDQLIIEIEDNGPGIYQTNQNRTSEKMHRSMGIRIPKDRLYLANVTNQLEINELKDEEGHISGTMVRLSLF